MARCVRSTLSTSTSVKLDRCGRHALCVYRCRGGGEHRSAEKLGVCSGRDREECGGCLGDGRAALWPFHEVAPRHDLKRVQLEHVERPRRAGHRQRDHALHHHPHLHSAQIGVRAPVDAVTSPFDTLARADHAAIQRTDRLWRRASVLFGAVHKASSRSLPDTAVRDASQRRAAMRSTGGR